MSICCITSKSKNFQISNNKFIFDDYSSHKMFAINDLEHLLIIGDTTIDYSMLYKLSQMGVPVTLMDNHCLRLGDILCDNKINSQIKLLQHKYCTNTKVLVPMRSDLVIKKAANRSLHLMKQNIKHHIKNVDKCIDEIEAYSHRVPSCNSAEKLLEYDDVISRYYFGGLFTIINDSLKIPVVTSGGIKKYFDVMLKFAYSILMNLIHTTVVSAGLDPYVGFLHDNNANSSALSLDLMSEYISIISDNIFLDMLSNKTLTMDDFIVDENTNTISIDENSAIRFIVYFENKINTFQSEDKNTRDMSFTQIIKYKINLIKSVLTTFEEKGKYIKPE